jgi:homoserine kinase type II
MSEPELVLNEFAGAMGPAVSAPSLAAAGFSGGQVWRLETRAGPWALRRWPESYPAERLAWIQATLRELPNSLPIPRPVLADTKQPYVYHLGALWTVEPWMPGSADYWANPAEPKLVAALQTLAEFHVAAARWKSEPRSIPAIGNRIAALVEHNARGDEYRAAVAAMEGDLQPWLSESCGLAQAASGEWLQRLRKAASVQAALIPCIRDVWHDHVLFTDSVVTGIVDFGAMRLDSLAVDVARLVGSLVGDPEGPRRLALSAYVARNPGCDRELELVDLIDGSSQVIAALNWVRWLCVERRAFSNLDRVAQRLIRLVGRLKLQPSIAIKGN